MPPATSRPPSAADLSHDAYQRLNVTIYQNALPPLPSVALVDRTDIFSLTRNYGEGAYRRLDPFVVSKHVTGALLMEAIRHEIAHTAAIFLDEDLGHGPAWQEHAKRTGATGHETLDPGHELRSSWPSW